MEKKVYGIVYMLIDGTNDFEYIGQTTQSLKVRFGQHKRGKQYVDRMIQDHGDLFLKIILKVCYSKEELDYWEKLIIKSRSTMFPNGYNFTSGGSGNWTPTPEFRLKLSAANRGKNHPMFGKHHTDATKAKLSAGNTGRRQSEATKALLSSLQTTKHAVICIETKEIFDSVAAAVRRYKVNRANLILACQNHQRTVDGKHFWYLEDFNKATEIVIPTPKTKPQKRKVVCLETGEVFETIRQAAKWLGMVHGAVSRACRKHMRAGGYHFRYLEEYKESETVNLTYKEPIKRRSIVCVETGEIFSSMRQAERSKDINHRLISQACKDSSKTAGGCHWKFVDEIQE